MNSNNKKKGSYNKRQTTKMLFFSSKFIFPFIIYFTISPHGTQTSISEVIASRLVTLVKIGSVILRSTRKLKVISTSKIKGIILGAMTHLAFRYCSNNRCLKEAEGHSRLGNSRRVNGVFTAQTRWWEGAETKYPSNFRRCNNLTLRFVC